MKFTVHSDFKPTGDQPQAIKQLANGILADEKYQTLLGVTGSGKTFTVANVIEEVQRPTLVLAHNKTLAAQLYAEFKNFFPNNAVEYFVSYYDYYQPEAYLPVSGTYIEKDLSINEELEKMRLSTTSSLLSGRRDVLVVASVSCLYGIGNPVEFQKNVIELVVGQTISRTKLLQRLVKSLYSRTEADFTPGNFRIKGDTVEIFPAYSDEAFRIHFFGDDIEEIETFDPKSGLKIDKRDRITIYPANMFVTSPDVLKEAIWDIQQDMVKQVEYFKSIGKHLEAKRLEERTNFDLEMIRELGYCSGIENYSRYLDRRAPGTRPFCLLDYFPKDYLMVVDESHVTISQVHAMYGGDRSRKENLVEYGFRLPAAMDNRPLKFEEFEAMQNQVLFVSATPADYELEKSGGEYVEQIIRPTGLLDPIVEFRDAKNQVDDMLVEARKVIAKGHRVLITTLTKKLAEELTTFYRGVGMRIRYLHSEIDTIERIEIIRDLRLGEFDILVGINLLREGLDIPEVALVGILDADKEGFLRSTRSLIQIIGRAARNEEGRVLLYGFKQTPSIKIAMETTIERRKKQDQFNQLHGIVPETILKKITGGVIEVLRGTKKTGGRKKAQKVDQMLSAEAIDDKIKELKLQMKEASKALEFEEAAKLRDEIKKLTELRFML